MSDKKSTVSVIEWFLTVCGVGGIISSFIWTFTEPDSRWMWFSRFALGIICLGFVGVMREIRKLRDKDD